MRLSTDIWVAALIRRAELGGAFAVVARRGDAQGGAVLVKVYNPLARAARLYSEAVRGDGEAVWMPPLASTEEADIDAYIERSGGSTRTCGWSRSRTCRVATS